MNSIDTSPKRLLKLAAKACGYRVVQYCDHLGLQVVFQDGVSEWWRPDLDDGDGARMESELRISLVYTTNLLSAHCQGIRVQEDTRNHNGNRQAARKMASLRVAAEVGRRMK